MRARIISRIYLHLVLKTSQRYLKLIIINANMSQSREDPPKYYGTKL